jgi:hypothetical protein
MRTKNERMVFLLPLKQLLPQNINWIPFLSTLKAVFSTNQLDALAIQHGFKKRKRKMKPEDFIALCAFYNEETGNQSLSQLCGKLYSFSNVHLTKEALNQRFNQQAVAFLQTVFHTIFQQQLLTSLPKISHLPFQRIRILDSTGFQTPTNDHSAGYQGCAQPGLKIQLEYELLQPSL